MGKRIEERDYHTDPVRPSEVPSLGNDDQFATTVIEDAFNGARKIDPRSSLRAFYDSRAQALETRYEMEQGGQTVEDPDYILVNL